MSRIAFTPKRNVKMDNKAGGNKNPIMIPNMQNIAILDLSNILLFRKLLLFTVLLLTQITDKNRI
jgi:hypothetical protein